MSEIVTILGVDPSLRNTGLAKVIYNTSTKKFQVKDCQVLVNPQKYTGTEAILNMIEMIQEESREKVYQEVDNVMVESPATMFSKTFSISTLSSIAHVSGAAVALFGVDRTYIFRPNEWNKSRKKAVTHNQTVAVLGDADKWHFKTRIKSEKYMEHVLDAASLALFWIKSNYIDEEELKC